MKKNRLEVRLNFPHVLDLRRCWGIEMPLMSQSSSKLELIIEKLKQTATMKNLYLMKNENIKKLVKA